MSCDVLLSRIEADIIDQIVQADIASGCASIRASSLFSVRMVNRDLYVGTGKGLAKACITEHAANDTPSGIKIPFVNAPQETGKRTAQHRLPAW